MSTLRHKKERVGLDRFMKMFASKKRTELPEGSYYLEKQYPFDHTKKEVIACDEAIFFQSELSSGESRPKTRALCFTPDGNYLLTSHHADAMQPVWELWQVLSPRHFERVWIAPSPTLNHGVVLTNHFIVFYRRGTLYFFTLHERKLVKKMNFARGGFGKGIPPVIGVLSPTTSIVLAFDLFQGVFRAIKVENPKTLRPKVTLVHEGVLPEDFTLHTAQTDDFYSELDDKISLLKRWVASGRFLTASNERLRKLLLRSGTTRLMLGKMGKTITQQSSPELKHPTMDFSLIDSAIYCSGYEGWGFDLWIEESE